MSRLNRAPRPSGLAAVQSAPAEVVEELPPAPVEQPVPVAPEPARRPALKRTKQGGYYAHDAEMERARAAWKHTELTPDGYASWSDFQLAAIMRLTEELEREHNGGKPWPPLPAGKVKHSRRGE